MNSNLEPHPESMRPSVSSAPTRNRAVRRHGLSRLSFFWPVWPVLLALALGCSAESRLGRHLERAERFYQQKSYREAELEYMSVLQIDPNHRLAIERLGAIFYEQGQTPRALAAFAKTKELQPENYEARLKLARLFLLLGQPQFARQEATAVLDAQPGNAQALLLVADAIAKKEDIADTETRLSQFQEKNGDSAAVRICLGRMALIQGDLGTAETQLLQAQTMDPKSSLAHLGLGTLRWAQRDPEAADSLFAKAAELEPTDWNIRLKRGEFKLLTGKPLEARQIAEPLLQGAPRHLPALTLLARVAFAERKYDECATLAQRILEQKAADPEAMLLRAQSSLENGDVPEAIRRFELVRDQYPKIPQFHYQLALAYARGNRAADALSSAKQAVSLQPHYDDAVLLSASLSAQAQDYTTAANLLSDLITRSPKVERAYPMLADVNRAQGLPDQALTVCEVWREQFPSSPQAFFATGMIQLQQQKSMEAKEAFEAALRLSPGFLPAAEQLIDFDLREKNYAAALARAEQLSGAEPAKAGAFLLLAKVHLAQGHSDVAEQALLKVLELEPGSTAGGVLLAQLYVRSNKRAEAVERLQTLVEKNPRDWGSFLLLGIVQQELKDYAKARASYEQVIKLNPNSAAALNNLAYVCVERLNDLNQGLSCAQKARQLAPEDPSIADTLGWAYCHQGEYGLALSLLREAAGKLPLNPEVQFHLATAHYMMGDEAEARAAFQRVLSSGAEFTGRPAAERRLWVLNLDPRTAGADDIARLKGYNDSGDVMALIRLGAVAEREGDPDQALALYQAAVKANSKSPALLLRLANFHSEVRHDAAEALAQGKLAVELAPRDPAVRHRVGQLAYHARDYRVAYSLLQESARERQSDPEVLFDLALAAYQQSHLAEAEQTMRRALEASSTFSRAAAARQFLELLTFARDPAVAAQHQGRIQEWLQAEPESVPVLAAAGAWREHAGQHAEARDIYETRLLKQNPEFGPAWRRLAELYAGPLQNDAKAFEAGQKARTAFPADAELATLLGKTAFRRQDFSTAIVLLTESAQQRPQDSEVFYTLGMAHHGLNQKEPARVALRKALALNLDPTLAQKASQVIAQLGD